MRLTTTPLYAQVRDLLVSRIAAGVWKPGEALPNETVLAEQLQTSKGTVRKALELLEREQLIVRRQGRGTFVHDFASSSAPSLFSTIYCPRGRAVAESKRAKSIDRLAAGEKVASMMGLRPEEEIVKVSRLRFHRKKCFMSETCFLALRYFRVLPEDLGDYRIFALAQTNGLVIGGAREEVSIAYASPQEAADLDVPEGTPLLQLDRQVLSDHQQVIEYRQARCALHNERYIVKFDLR